jgi:type VI secretion system protein VasD
MVSADTLMAHPNSSAHAGAVPIAQCAPPYLYWPGTSHIVDVDQRRGRQVLCDLASGSQEKAPKMANFSSPRRHSLAIAIAPFLVWFGGCAKPPPPPPPPTVIKVTLAADPAVNPDGHGRPSPIVLRLYELKTVAAFGRADFFSLWDREKDTLGAELVARDEVQLRPGESRTIERPAGADAQQLAVVAAYRDIERADWRGAIALRQHEVNAVAVAVGARSVSMTSH